MNNDILLKNKQLLEEILIHEKEVRPDFVALLTSSEPEMLSKMDSYLEKLEGDLFNELTIGSTVVNELYNPRIINFDKDKLENKINKIESLCAKHQFDDDMKSLFYRNFILEIIAGYQKMEKILRDNDSDYSKINWGTILKIQGGLSTVGTIVGVGAKAFFLIQGIMAGLVAVTATMIAGLILIIAAIIAGLILIILAKKVEAKILVINYFNNHNLVINDAVTYSGVIQYLPPLNYESQGIPAGRKVEGIDVVHGDFIHVRKTKIAAFGATGAMKFDLVNKQTDSVEDSYYFGYCLPWKDVNKNGIGLYKSDKFSSANELKNQLGEDTEKLYGQYVQECIGKKAQLKGVIDLTKQACGLLTLKPK